MNLAAIFKTNTSDEELTGLGGWLLLVGLGILGSAAKNAYELIATYVPLFSDDRWGAMTSPASKHYNPDLALFAGLEAGALAVLLALNAYVIVLFFTRRHSFPKTFIALLVVSLVFSLADLAAFAWLVPGQEVFDDASIATLAGSVFSLVVWGAYIHRSRRVRLTFTR